MNIQENALIPLISEKDNIELIRHRIVEILSFELENQKNLAESAGLSDKDLYNIAIFEEALRPYDYDHQHFPLINVLLNETQEQKGSNAILGSQNYTANFEIQCYAKGTSFDEQGEFISDVQQSFTSAWVVARLVRNILMSGQYAFFGMKKKVLRRRLSGLKAGVPSDLAQAGFSVACVVLSFSVDFFEDAPEVSPIEIDEFGFKIVDDNGRILVEN
ncbi:MAG: hypothetical protein ACRC4W_02485 [Treponemataceae bacterium]